MEGLKRHSFQGVTNIIRFNWHFYVIALSFTVIFFATKKYLPQSFATILLLLVLLSILGIITSLIISFYIYDRSDLYSLKWLNFLNIGSNKKIVNINAGFDEISLLLKEKYPDSTLAVYDFYDPAKHTEISIERARKAYPPLSETIKISTDNVSIESDSIDYIFLVFAAHEIRNDQERINFFQHLSKSLRKDGRIIIAEHQRAINNFIAYNIGFLHFLPSGVWCNTFEQAGLTKESITTHTPFITIYVLKKNGSTT